MAEKSRVNIKAYNDAYITTNDNGDISGKDAHDLFRDLADSSLMKEDIINDDTTGGIDKPASAEIVKTHGIEIDDVKATTDINTSEIYRIQADLKDDINGVDNAVDKNTADIKTINLDLVALIKKYGANGRVRFDNTNKHFYFEVLEGSNWVVKAEIGQSIIVDAVRLIKGEKPTNILPQEIALYNREVTLSDGTKSIRPMFVLPDGSEYGMVVSKYQTNEILFRNNVGDLIHIPIIYSHNGLDYMNFNRISFSGLVDVLMSQDELKVNILNNIDDSAKKSDRAYSSNKIESLIPTPDKIVADINEKLGNTDWQKGQTDESIGVIDGGDSSVIEVDNIDGGNSLNL